MARPSTGITKEATNLTIDCEIKAVAMKIANVRHKQSLSQLVETLLAKEISAEQRRKGAIKKNLRPSLMETPVSVSGK